MGVGRIEFRDFSVSYPGFHLGPVAISLTSGDRIALVGPNGAGKTTLLQAIAGRLGDYSGQILVDGRDVAESVPGVRRNIGFLPERLRGFPWMTVREHLRFLATFYPGWDASFARDQVHRLELDEDKRLGNLSEGMKVKLSFVAAEAHRPPFLLLDEPTSGLDPLIRSEVLEILQERLEATPERLLLFSTHILEDVGTVAERVLVLQDGVLRADTTVNELQAGIRTVGEGILSVLSKDAERELRSGRLG